MGLGIPVTSHSLVSEERHPRLRVDQFSEVEPARVDGLPGPQPIVDVWCPAAFVGEVAHCCLTSLG